MWETSDPNLRPPMPPSYSVLKTHAASSSSTIYSAACVISFLQGMQQTINLSTVASWTCLRPPPTGRHRPRRHPRPFFILKPNVLHRPIDDQTNIQLPSVPVPVRRLYIAITPRTTGATPCSGLSRRPPQLIDVSKRGVESPDSEPVMCVCYILLVFPLHCI